MFLFLLMFSKLLEKPVKNIYYNLDPAQYFRCPGFAWDAMLKMTDINKELITDIGMS